MAGDIGSEDLGVAKVFFVFPRPRSFWDMTVVGVGETVIFLGLPRLLGVFVAAILDFLAILACLLRMISRYLPTDSFAKSNSAFWANICFLRGNLPL